MADELDLVHPIKSEGKTASLETFRDALELMKIFLKMTEVLLLLPL